MEWNENNSKNNFFVRPDEVVEFSKTLEYNLPTSNQNWKEQTTWQILIEVFLVK